MKPPRRRKSFRERVLVISGREEWNEQPKLKLFVIVITAHLNRQDLAWPQIKEIKRKAGVGKTWIWHASKKLEREGMLMRRKLTEGEVYPNDDVSKQYPVRPGQYLYHPTAKLYDEEPDPNGMPEAILRPFYGTKSGSPSEPPSKENQGSVNSSSQVQPANKSGSLSEPPLNKELHKNNKKEQFGQEKPALRKHPNRISELAWQFEKNEPIDPEFLRFTIAECVEDKIPIPQIVQGWLSALERKNMLSRLSCGKIDLTAWSTPTTPRQLTASDFQHTSKSEQLDHLVGQTQNHMKLDS